MTAPSKLTPMIPPGYELLVRRISFSTLVGLAARVGFASGIVACTVTMFIVALTGGEKCWVYGVPIKGYGEAAASFLWLPPLLACCAWFTAASAYLPLRMWMARTGGFPMDLTLYRRSDLSASTMPGNGCGGSARPRAN